METLRIEILNPKAKRVLKALADLKLINIKPKITYKDFLEKLRQKAADAPSLEEITEETEQVRQARNAKKR